jgi:hypothetical protein
MKPGIILFVKRRIKILLVIVVVAAGAITHFYHGLFTPYNYLTAKWDIAKSKPRILQYGYRGSMITDKQAIVIAPKYGFNYDIVGDCEMTTPLVNGINAYNAVTIKFLNGKLGNDWKKKFDIEIDSLFRVYRVDTIRKIVLAIDEVKIIDDYLDSVSGGKEHLYIWVLPQEKDEPNVRVGRIMPDMSRRVFYYYQVDPYSLKSTRILY